MKYCLFLLHASGVSADLSSSILPSATQVLPSRGQSSAFAVVVGAPVVVGAAAVDAGGGGGARQASD